MSKTVYRLNVWVHVPHEEHEEYEGECGPAMSEEQITRHVERLLNKTADYHCDVGCADWVVEDE